MYTKWYFNSLIPNFYKYIVLSTVYKHIQLKILLKFNRFSHIFFFGMWRGGHDEHSKNHFACVHFVSIVTLILQI